MSDEILEQLRVQTTPVEPPRAFLAAVKGRRIRRRVVRAAFFVGVIVVAVVTAFMIPMGPTSPAPRPGGPQLAPISQGPVHLPDSSWARLIRDNRDLPPERMVLGAGVGTAPSKPIGVRGDSASTLGL